MASATTIEHNKSNENSNIKQIAIRLFDKHNQEHIYTKACKAWIEYNEEQKFWTISTDATRLFTKIEQEISKSSDANNKTDANLCMKIVIECQELFSISDFKYIYSSNYLVRAKQPEPIEQLCKKIETSDKYGLALKLAQLLFHKFGKYFMCSLKNWTSPQWTKSPHTWIEYDDKLCKWKHSSAEILISKLKQFDLKSDVVKQALSEESFCKKLVEELIPFFEICCQDHIAVRYSDVTQKIYRMFVLPKDCISEEFVEILREIARNSSRPLENSQDPKKPTIFDEPSPEDSKELVEARTFVNKLLSSSRFEESVNESSLIPTRFCIWFARRLPLKRSTHKELMKFAEAHKNDVKEESFTTHGKRSEELSDISYWYIYRERQESRENHMQRMNETMNMGDN